jgi:hypothetical protein
MAGNKRQSYKLSFRYFKNADVKRQPTHLWMTQRMQKFNKNRLAIDTTDRYLPQLILAIPGANSPKLD